MHEATDHLVNRYEKENTEESQLLGLSSLGGLITTELWE